MGPSTGINDVKTEKFLALDADQRTFTATGSSNNGNALESGASGLLRGVNWRKFTDL
jgi:hypothetical protein